MNSIFDYLNNVSKEERVFNKNDIYNVIYMLYKEYGLEDTYNIYIKKDYKYYIKSDDVRTVCGEFLLQDGICMYINNIRKYCKYIYKINKDFLGKLSGYDKYMIFNIKILNFINHEFEHLLYEQGLNDFDSDFEETLMNMEEGYYNCDDIIFVDIDDEEFKHEVSLRKEKYETYYDISFLERITQINALERTNNFLKNYKEIVKMQLLLNEIELYNFQTTSYLDDFDNPTQRFFRAIGKENEFNQLDTLGFGCKDKLKYGLKLSFKDTVNTDFYGKKLRNKFNRYL